MESDNLTIKNIEAIQNGKLIPQANPIVELRIEGQVGFERLELDTKELQKSLQSMSQALIFLLKYDVEDRDFDSPLAEDVSREQIERSAFLDLLAGHRDYKKRADNLAAALIELKSKRLAAQSDDELYQYLENLLVP